MSKIQIICIGKIKNSLWEASVNEYSKRISRFCSLEIVELKEIPLPDHPTPRMIEKTLHKEGLEIEEKKNKEAAGFALDMKGSSLHSIEFSRLLNQHLFVQGQPIAFMIGSSHGLSSTIKKKYPCISFSSLTFPHQLCRVLLLEQIFRGFKIQAREVYHK
jgi:23S rRNA (pseudouridine1915-N3)-methyltransferase